MASPRDFTRAAGRPRISADGRYVAFWSDASDLVAGDTNGVRDVFLHDRDADGNGVFDETTPGGRTTTRVSVATNGTQGNAASAADGEPLLPGTPLLPGEPADGQLDLSPDGLWVVFRSEASNLVPGDTNGVADIFLRSVTGQQTTRVSVAANGTQADGASQSPAVSAGAQRIVFASAATNLVPGDTNGLRDVFLVERSSGQVVRLSDATPGVDADGASDMPAIDDAGRTVAFATRATNLLPSLATSTTSQIVVVTLPTSSAPAVSGAVSARGDQRHGRAEAAGLRRVAAGRSDRATGQRAEHAAGGVRHWDLRRVCDRRDEPDAERPRHQRRAGRRDTAGRHAAAGSAAGADAGQQGQRRQPGHGGDHARRTERRRGDRGHGVMGEPDAWGDGDLAELDVFVRALPLAVATLSRGLGPDGRERDADVHGRAGSRPARRWCSGRRR